MNSLDRFAQNKLAALEAKRLRRVLAADRRLSDLWVERRGRKLLSFSCNDYLNLSHDVRVKQAAADAALAHGAGAGASRLVTGNHDIVRALEARLAAFKGTEAACAFGAGYLANIGIIPTLMRAGDAIFVDELSHACMWAGAKLSDARVISFAHNDMEDLQRFLVAHRGEVDRALIISEGVFSMDGDQAPLTDLREIADAHDAWLLIDDAHGLGVLGGGVGTAAEQGVGGIHLQMGTLSKALGAYGGYVCASAPVIDLLKTRARSLVYSTGISPANAGAALAALNIIASEPELCAEPLAKARRFTRALNLPLAQSAIVPLVLGAPEAALDAASKLEEAGFLVVAIRPPTVPDGTARLRFAFSAGHKDEDIDRLANAVRALLPAAA